MNAEASPGFGRREFAVLTAILLLSCALRLPGLGFGLDPDGGPDGVLDHQNDELSMAMAVRDGMVVRDADVGVFLHWGTLGMHLYRAGDRFLYEAPPRASLSRQAIERADLSEWLRCHRLLSVCASLLTIVFVYALARALVGVHGAALAALLLGSCYLHAREARFGTLDSFLALYTVGVALASCRLVERPGARGAAGAFALVGFAAAVKYSGALLIGLPVLAIIFAARRAPSGRRRAVLLLMVWSPLAAVAWLASSPHIFDGWAELRQVLADQSAVVGMRVSALPAVLKYHALQTFGVGLGWPVAALAAIGAALAVIQPKKRPGALILLAAFLILFTTRTTAVRYGEPLVGFAAIFAAGVIVAGAKHLGGRRAVAVALFITLLVSVPSFSRTYAFVRLIQAEDTRVEALRFLNARAPAPNDVLQFATYGATRYPNCWDFLRMVYRNRTWSLEDALALRPRFLVADVSDPDIQPWGIDAFLAAAGDEYRLAWSVDGRVRDEEGVMALPEHVAGTPNFLVPWARPWRMNRPGPAIKIWERVSP